MYSLNDPLNQLPLQPYQIAKHQQLLNNLFNGPGSGSNVMNPMPSMGFSMSPEYNIPHPSLAPQMMNNFDVVDQDRKRTR
jgi:hypothetical protein